MTKRLLSYPHDWECNPLRDLLSSLTSGSRPSGGGNGDSNGVFSLGGEHITDDGRFVFDNPQYVPRCHYDDIKDKADVAVGDILINKDGAKTGKLALVQQDFPFFPACINEHLFRLRVDNHKIEPEYLFNFLLSNLGQYQIQAEVQGSAQGGIIRRFAKFVKVGYPKESEERKEILSFLEAVDSALDAARAELLAAQRLKTSLMQQLFTKGIPGRHRDFINTKYGVRPSSWAFMKCRDAISGDVRNGYSPNCPQEPTGFWILSLENLTTEGYRVKGVKSAPEHNDKLHRFLLEVDDILVSRSNTPELVGLAARYPGEPAPCYYPDLIMKFRANTKVCSPAFLEFYLQSTFARRWFRARASGTSGSMVKIKRRDLQQMPFFRPEPNEQDEIVRIILSSKNAMKVCEERILALTTLKKSLLQNLLTGKVRVNMEAQV